MAKTFYGENMEEWENSSRIINKKRAAYVHSFVVFYFKVKA